MYNTYNPVEFLITFDLSKRIEENPCVLLRKTDQTLSLVRFCAIVTIDISRELPEKVN